MERNDQEPGKMKLDALVVAAHPDDAEISVGGTILRLLDAGAAVGIVDATRGELGTRGSVGERGRETEAASAYLGLPLRVNLDQPDGQVADTQEVAEALALLIRGHRPDLLLAHHCEDLHPDHVACGRLTRRAWYLSGLARLAERDGGPEAWRPSRLFHFMGHVPFDPTLVVRIDEVWPRKVELIRCYASQIEPADREDDGSHLLFGADILARAETKARYWGERIGCGYGEPLLHVGPLSAEGANLF